MKFKIIKKINNNTDINKTKKNFIVLFNTQHFLKKCIILKTISRHTDRTGNETFSFLILIFFLFCKKDLKFNRFYAILWLSNLWAHKMHRRQQIIQNTNVYELVQT